MSSLTQSQAIPQMPALPVIGNIITILRSGRLNFLLRVSRECGDIGSFRLGSRQIILLNSPAYAAKVLVEYASSFEKPILLRAGLGLLGNGLLTSKNAPNRQHRKLIAPAFTPHGIAAYADVVAVSTQQFCRAWTKARQIDMERAMMGLMLQLLGKTLFDADVGVETDEISRALNIIQRRIIDQSNALINLPPNWQTPANKRFIEARARLDTAIYRLIHERRQSHEERSDALSRLVHAQDEAGNKMPDQQIRDEVITLLLAGQETTASVLTWAWYLLIKHPETYARMQSEVAQALAGRIPTFADLPNLPYTLQVLKETLRLYPASYIFSRSAQKDVPLGDYFLPAHSRVWLSPYTMHRRPDIFPDPERFDPDRFTPPREAALPRHAYIPFGAGPRNCIGNHFALMIGQIVLATLTQLVTFDLAPGQRIKPEAGIILRPKNGLRMIVRPTA